MSNLRLSGLGSGGNREWKEHQSKETVLLLGLRSRTYKNTITNQLSSPVHWLYRMTMTQAQEEAIEAILGGKLPTQPVEEWGDVDKASFTTNGFPVVTGRMTTPWSGQLNGGGLYATCCNISREQGLIFPTPEEIAANRGMYNSSPAPHNPTNTAASPKTDNVEGKRDVAF